MLNMFSRLPRVRTILSLCSVFVFAVQCRYNPQCHHCEGNGFEDCFRTFSGSFNETTNKTRSVEDTHPQGLERFAYNTSGGIKVAKICEGWSDDLGGTFASYYDCNLKIPLYTAISLTAYQLKYGMPVPRNSSFRQSDKIRDKNCQGNDESYKNVTNVLICYYDKDWNCICDCHWWSLLKNNYTSLDRGHSTAFLFAWDFDKDRGTGRGKDTFVYTNAFPQFRGFNRGSWRVAECNVIRKWVYDECELGKENLQMNISMLYIVTGTVPSTATSQHTRFFGKYGFSNFMSSDFPINVPSYVWMAACCKYKTNESDEYKFKSTAVYGENFPTNGPPSPNTTTTTVTNLEKFLSEFSHGPTINLFPGQQECSPRFNKRRRTGN